MEKTLPHHRLAEFAAEDRDVTIKPKPRKRRTRDVRRWVIYWKSGHMDEQMHTAEEKRSIGKSGDIAKWLPVVVNGVPVRK